MRSRPNRTASQRIYDDLQRAIVEGEIAAGSKISETDLAQKYQVSRAPLREALTRLERCHLIERVPHVGARVVDLTLESLHSLYDLRAELEGLACRLAAQCISKEDIAQLHTLLDEHFRSQRVRDGESYYQEAGDVDFHYRIIQACQNPYLINILSDELYHLMRMYRVQLGMNGPRVSKAFDEHRAILNAIEQGDGELAAMLMQRHVLVSKNNMAKKLEEYQRQHSKHARN